MVPAPVGPVTPAGPVAPADPVGPVGPGAPAPVAPAGPVDPVTPVGPGSPLAPFPGPCGPIGPVAPVGPAGPVALTPCDILTLKVLAERRGEVVGRTDIVEEVSGMDSVATLRTVDNHIVALRRAIGDNPRRPRWLHTVRGEGYRLSQA